MIEHGVGEKLKVPEPAEGRSARIEVQEVPVAMESRWNSREDGRNRPGAVPQDGSKGLPVGKGIGEEVMGLDAGPAERIDEHKDGNAMIRPSLLPSQLLDCQDRRIEAKKNLLGQIHHCLAYRPCGIR